MVTEFEHAHVYCAQSLLMIHVGAMLTKHRLETQSYTRGQKVVKSFSLGHV
ncbi:hypothetical protein JCM19239_1840 [Vibrio variabilis]|uniref:Uncharacterized protein n=1 Tax=Vibrio variabilis TaxID=990271 RepID=A0ABQ0JQT8_9VIBR|nr:hypothetical protein JCM19239_1840 [Vibrio variabilis]